LYLNRSLSLAGPRQDALGGHDAIHRGTHDAAGLSSPIAGDEESGEPGLQVQAGGVADVVELNLRYIDDAGGVGDPGNDPG
jgi:hypothetical protein